MLYEFIRARTDGMRRSFDLDGYTYWSKQDYQTTTYYKAPIDTNKFEPLSKQEFWEARTKKYPNSDLTIDKLQQVTKIGIVW